MDALDAQDEIIRGEARAVAEEAHGRDLAFLLDTPAPLCGTWVLPLDLRNLLLLTEAGNAFVCGGVADVRDVWMLLWLQSPHFCLDETARQRFVDTLPDLDEDAACADIRTWIEATFADAPSGGKEKPVGLGGDVPVASFVASWVDLLGSEYGWVEEKIVGTPTRRGVALERLYQYQRCILRRHNPKHPLGSAARERFHFYWFFGGGQEAYETAQASQTAFQPSTQ